MYTTVEVVTIVIKRNKDHLLANFIFNINEDVKEKYISAATMIQHVCDMSSSEEDAIGIFNNVSAKLFSDGKNN